MVELAEGGEETEIPLHPEILGIVDSEYLIGVGIMVCAVIENVAQQIKEVSRNLGICPHGVYVFLNSASPGHVLPLVGMIETVSHPHYEMVFITVS